MTGVPKPEDVQQDLLDELLECSSILQNIDMTLPFKRKDWRYTYCPHCEGLNAFEMLPEYHDRSILIGCSTCNGEYDYE